MLSYLTDLQRMLKHQEGTGPVIHGRFMPYPDSVGKVTIGYGRNVDDRGISNEEALVLFNNDIADAIEDVTYCVSGYDQLSKARKMVLVSMAFNMGRTRFSTFAKMLDAVHRGEWEHAADEILDSDAARALPGRYGTLAAMMRYDTTDFV